MFRLMVNSLPYFVTDMILMTTFFISFSLFFSEIHIRLIGSLTKVNLVTFFKICFYDHQL